ncbi:MAG: hypothetical protein JWL69_544 [Phycisphaerales bacterium]|jgi:hypothetical protein|nr:hypothetical protein [Phycisphaerales bacterium]MDB5354213.1 hypothetical protein [Phycisphaerales bacterium]
MGKIFGGLIVAAGIFLWCGNVFGFFRTFPLAGYLTIVIGGVVMKAGS